MVNVLLKSVRQGDVYLRSYGKLVLSRHSSRSRSVGKRFVLAEGEVTGHAHVLESDEDIMLLDERGGRLYLRVAEPGARVVHEEHTQLEIPAGDYVATVQQEYDPELQQRAVQD